MRLARSLAPLALLLALAGPSPAAPRPAPAVTVDYTVALAGLMIGTAQLAGTFEGARYRLAVRANLTGLVGAITGGVGAANARGALARARALPAAFAVSSRSANQSITIRMALERGDLVQAEIVPALVEYPDRVPLGAAERRGIVDPVSALLMPALARVDLTDPANCERTIPVFDGVSRFDLDLTYAETRRVEKPGYSGPVLVCNARYRAIAGHRPDRPGVKFMEDNRELSVWLAPVAEARVLVPVRISVLTELGTNVIEATRWSRGAPPEPVTVASATPILGVGN